MPIRFLQLGGTLVTDLSLLRGMSLISLTCYGSRVTDFSLLPELPLKSVYLSSNPERHADILRSIKTAEVINDKPAAEFWKALDAKKAP